MRAFKILYVMLPIKKSGISQQILVDTIHYIDNTSNLIQSVPVELLLVLVPLDGVEVLPPEAVVALQGVRLTHLEEGLG